MQLFKQIETLFRTGMAGGLTDGQLLDRFVQQRDEAAFAVLVDRHGAMVLRVCRQVLGDEHDAQDASQATFLVLARRAGSIGRRESVGCWLHGVALRVAAKARVAAARRRAHERRGAALAAGRLVEQVPTTPEERERWTSLHEELGRLPETFRAPIVLCYLEGLTQEQAAAQLNAPLGTIQSRLARGRARLKARLEQRGVDASAAIPGAALAAAPPSPAPAAWVEPTTRLAMEFSRGTTTRTAAGLAVALAEEVLRAMLIGKIKVLAGMILIATVLATGVIAWAKSHATRATNPPHVAIKESPPAREPQAAPPQAEPERTVKRTVRGIVRDEQGRAVAGAWIGNGVHPVPDVWAIITLPDRIRVTAHAYRDPKGGLIPAGSLGKYFEYRDDSGTWQPVHPDDIRRYDRSQGSRVTLTPRQQAALEKVLPDGLLEIRLQKGRHWMTPLDFVSESAASTDSEGRFAVEVSFHLPRFPDNQIHFASAVFLREADQVVRFDRPDRPVEITVRPTRPVRARVIETPKDHPEMSLHWRVYSVDSRDGNAYYIDAIRGMGLYWPCAFLSSQETDSPIGQRRLEARLPAGRYKVVFESPTLDRIVDFVVPAGEGPVDLPDIRLESLAWVKMLGKPAAEIEATDLEGNPVKLADYRGKVVLLTFWGTQDFEWSARLDRLAVLHRRLKDERLAILALHDASVASLDALKTAVAHVLDRYPVRPDSPFRLLLDRAPTGKGTGPFGLQAGESGSGRTSDRYEVVGPTSLVIDEEGRLAVAHKEDVLGSEVLANGKEGELVWEAWDDSEERPDPVQAGNALDPSSLLNALEDKLGLPRTPRPGASPRLPHVRARPPREPEDPIPPPPLDVPLFVMGNVVGLEGNPVAGAKISSRFPMAEEHVKTDLTGAFSFMVDSLVSEVPIKIEAPGLATRTFWAYYPAEDEDQRRQPVTEWIIDPTGRISKPLLMGPGVVVTGQVVRGEKPMVGATIVVSSCASSLVNSKDIYPQSQEDIEAKTDEKGFFRIEHVAAGQDLEYAISAKPGSLEDHLTVIPRRFQAPRDGPTIDLGELEARPGHTLAGRLIFSDGKSAPPGAEVWVIPEYLKWLSSRLDEGGRFEVKGIPDGSVRVYIFCKDQSRVGFSDSIPGYRLSPRNKCLDPTSPKALHGMVEREITDLTILLEPGEKPEHLSGTVAKFNEAKAGPITGVPPGYDPKRP
jgi:RNA polymerase sigma factor (sigma-70 family)